VNQSEGSCYQFQSHSSDCQLVLTKFDIIHRLDLGKFIPSQTAALFAKAPQIRNPCECSCTWTDLKDVTLGTKHKLRI